MYTYNIKHMTPSNYIRSTVYRNRFLFNNQPDALIIQIYSVIKLYMFRASSLPIIGSFLTVHSALVSFMQFWMTASKQGHAGTLDSAWKRSPKTCMKLTSAECTVENS